MIHCNELRIGNWVVQHMTDMVEPEQQITSIGLNAVSTTDLNQVVKFDKLFPIKLTPEILEKCGFVKKGGETVLDEIYYTNGLLSLYAIAGDANQWCPSIKNTFWASTLRHLHQLQNLYHSLTGNELTVNQ